MPTPTTAVPSVSAPPLGAGASRRPLFGPPVLLARPARAVRWGDAVGLVVWASLLLVVVLWERNGGVQDLTSGTSGALTSLGRLTGLLAADLLLLQVLAMARIPWVERAVGQDRLTRWHRRTGFTSFHLMAAHIVLVTLGYAAAASTGALATFWDLVTTAPGMLLATAGTAALIAVVVSSIRAARRRLRYESWHLLHLYAYVGAFLALPHQLWTGADFLFSPAATAYWWTLWALAAGAVVVHRVAAPLLLSARHRFAVSAVHEEAPGVVVLHLAGRDLHRLRVAAGQFFVWRFLTGPGWTRGHPLSLSAAPTSAGLRLTIGTEGDDGARLAAIRPGTRVLAEGPYGRLTSDVRVRPRLAVIAAGVGIAPLLALVEEQVYRRTDDAAPILIHRAGTERGLIHVEDVARLAAAGVEVVRLVGRRSRTCTPWLPASSGHVPGPVALAEMIPDLPLRDVFVCGPDTWSDAVVSDLHAAGVAQEAIHLETFTW